MSVLHSGVREAATSASFDVQVSMTSYTFLGSKKSRRRVSFEEREDTWGVLVVNLDSIVWIALKDIMVLQRSASDARCVRIQEEGWQFKNGCEREVFCCWLKVLGSSCRLEADAECVPTRLPEGSFSVRAETCSSIIGQLTETTVVVAAANDRGVSEMRFDGKSIALHEVQFNASASNGRRLDLTWISADRTGWSSASIERAASSGKFLKPSASDLFLAASTTSHSSETTGSTRRATLYLASSIARELFLARCHQLAHRERKDKRPLRILCATMNTGDGKPPQEPHSLDSWLPTGEADVYAIGFQENSEKRKWLKAIEHHLCVIVDDIDEDSKYTQSWSLCEQRLKARGLEELLLFDTTKNTRPPLYTLAASSTLWDIHLLVFLRRGVRLAAPVATATEATGFAHVLGNKGAAAVALELSTNNNSSTISLMFVSSHLAARATRLGHRQSNYEEIACGLRRLSAVAHPSLRTLQPLHQFDAVFWMGDLNYRVDCGSHGDENEYHTCLKLAESDDFTALLSHDQLNNERENHAAVLSLFREPFGGPHFAPTYRLVKGKPREYSNKKFQNPSYCDRVLFKTHNTTWLLIEDDDDPDLQQSPRTIHYEADFTEPMAMSDHRPVRALFELDPKPLPAPACTISSLDAVWLSLEDIVFVLAPETSPRGTDTFFRYDGYAGQISLHPKASFLLERNDHASFGRETSLNLAASCTAPARCEAAKADAHERLQQHSKNSNAASSRLDTSAAACAVWAATTPSWAWPHFSTPPLFSRVLDHNWLAREKLAVVLNKVDVTCYGGSDPCLGVAEISLDLPVQRLASAKKDVAPFFGDVAPSSKVPTSSSNKKSELMRPRRPWDIAHVKYDDPLWTKNKECERSRLFDALIDEDGAHYGGGDGGAAVFSSPVVRHGKWIGTLSGRVRMSHLPDLAQVKQSEMLSHLAAWQQVAHIDAVVNQAYAAENDAAAIIDSQEPAAAVVRHSSADELEGQDERDTPMKNQVAAEVHTAEAFLGEDQAAPSEVQIQSTPDDDEQSDDFPLDKLRFTECGDPLEDDLNVEDEEDATAHTVVPAVSRRASDDPRALAAPAVLQHIQEQDEIASPAPPRLHSLNPKRDTKLLRECQLFDLLYRGDHPVLSDNEDDDQDSDDDDIDDDDAANFLSDDDDERVYLENETVVLERKQQRLPLNEFCCVDTGKSLQNIDFAFGPDDGEPRTREAHLKKFGEWLDAATLRPLKKSDNFIVACGGLKWMPHFFCCAKSGVKLNASTPFYEYEKRPYSEEAYREMFFTCHLCQEVTAFDGSDGVRALGVSWHRRCYHCAEGDACPSLGVLKDDVAWGHDAQDGRGVMPYCEICYRVKYTRHCPSCGDSVLPGVDDYVEACGELWHSNHFCCAATGVSLVDKSYYEHEGLAYTPAAYFEKYGEYCEYCGEIINGNDIVRAAGHSFHPDHFICRASGRAIPRKASGEYEFYVGDDGEIYDAESYAEHFTSNCFMCGDPIGGLADRRDLGPPQKPPEGGGTGGVHQESLFMVPSDRPVSYHPECLVCVVSGAQLEADSCYIGDDDGLAYCLEAYEAKSKRCFLTDTELGDKPAILNGLGLIFSERAYRSTHTDDWCAGCLTPLIAAEDAGTDPRWGLKWHPACANEHNPKALSEKQVKVKSDDIAAAKHTACQELQSRIDAYLISQRNLLDRARDNCRVLRHQKEDTTSVDPKNDEQRAKTPPQVILPRKAPPTIVLPEAKAHEEDVVTDQIVEVSLGVPIGPSRSQEIEEAPISRETEDVTPKKPSTPPQFTLEDREISVPSFVPPLSTNDELNDVENSELDAIVEGKTESGNPMAATISRRASRLSSSVELLKIAAKTEARGECFEGFLNKRGGGTSVFGRKNWLERYFVISNDSILHYYRDKDSYLGGGRPLKDAAYQLSTCRVSTIPGNAKSPSMAINHITIEPMSRDAGGRQLELRANSPEDHDRWFEELKRRAAKI